LRLVAPVIGWVSLHTSDTYEVMKPCHWKDGDLQSFTSMFEWRFAKVKASQQPHCPESSVDEGAAFNEEDVICWANISDGTSPSNAKARRKVVAMQALPDAPIATSAPPSGISSPSPPPEDDMSPLRYADFTCDLLDLDKDATERTIAQDCLEITSGGSSGSSGMGYSASSVASTSDCRMPQTVPSEGNRTIAKSVPSERRQHISNSARLEWRSSCSIKQLCAEDLMAEPESPHQRPPSKSPHIRSGLIEAMQSHYTVDAEWNPFSDISSGPKPSGFRLVDFDDFPSDDGFSFGDLLPHRADSATLQFPAL